MDAAVADQHIQYPNDLSSLNEAREKAEDIIDYLFEKIKTKLKVKPRRYCKAAHKKYITEAKKRQKKKNFTLNNQISAKLPG